MHKKSIITSISIGREKLLALMRLGGTGEITHLPTPRWKNLLAKKYKFIRFHNSTFNESVICIVKDVRLVKLAGETVVKVTLK